eukprot:3212782-Pleurochrysis_carterae.AAC.1
MTLCIGLESYLDILILMIQRILGRTRLRALVGAAPARVEWIVVSTKLGFPRRPLLGSALRRERRGRWQPSRNLADSKVAARRVPAALHTCFDAPTYLRSKT